MYGQYGPPRGQSGPNPAWGYGRAPAPNYAPRLDTPSAENINYNYQSNYTPSSGYGSRTESQNSAQASMPVVPKTESVLRIRHLVEHGEGGASVLVEWDDPCIFDMDYKFVVAITGHDNVRLEFPSTKRFLKIKVQIGNSYRVSVSVQSLEDDSMIAAEHIDFTTDAPGQQRVPESNSYGIGNANPDQYGQPPPQQNVRPPPRYPNQNTEAPQSRYGAPTQFQPNQPRYPNPRQNSMGFVPRPGQSPTRLNQPRPSTGCPPAKAPRLNAPAPNQNAASRFPTNQNAPSHFPTNQNAPSRFPTNQMGASSSAANHGGAPSGSVNQQVASAEDDDVEEDDDEEEPVALSQSGKPLGPGKARKAAKRVNDMKTFMHDEGGIEMCRKVKEILAEYKLFEVDMSKVGEKGNQSSKFFVTIVQPFGPRRLVQLDQKVIKKIYNDHASGTLCHELVRRLLKRSNPFGNKGKRRP